MSTPKKNNSTQKQAKSKSIGVAQPAPSPGSPPELNVAARLRSLRLRSRFSMRHLADQAGVSVGYVSGVESGAISPTIATLRKLLLAMGTDIGTFFQETDNASSGPVFRRENMPFISDEGCNYTMVLPQRDGIEILIIDEEFLPTKTPPIMETLRGDLAGYVLRGEVLLEVEGEPQQVLRPGDAFYIKAGRMVRGHAAGEESARLLTVESSRE